MKLDERALLQERVRTLVLRHALEAALERLAGTARAAGADVEAELLGLERSLLSAARGLADRAAAQKLAILVAVEDAGATIRAAFDSAHARLDQSGLDVVAAAGSPGPAALAA